METEGEGLMSATEEREQEDDVREAQENPIVEQMAPVKNIKRARAWALRSVLKGRSLSKSWLKIKAFHSVRHIYRTKLRSALANASSTQRDRFGFCCRRCETQHYYQCPCGSFLNHVRKFHDKNEIR